MPLWNISFPISKKVKLQGWEQKSEKTKQKSDPESDLADNLEFPDRTFKYLRLIAEGI